MTAPETRIPLDILLARILTHGHARAGARRFGQDMLQALSAACASLERRPDDPDLWASAALIALEGYVRNVATRDRDGLPRALGPIEAGPRAATRLMEALGEAEAEARESTAWGARQISRRHGPPARAITAPTSPRAGETVTTRIAARADARAGRTQDDMERLGRAAAASARLGGGDAPAQSRPDPFPPLAPAEPAAPRRRTPLAAALRWIIRGDKA